MLSYLIDDAFYYIVPAHSFAHGNGWSFDGITRTSGFQVLYGYLAAMVALIVGWSPVLPIAMAIVSTMALLTGVYLLLVRVGCLYGASTAGLAIVLMLVTPSVRWQITGGLEWSWLVLTTTLLVVALLLEQPKTWPVALTAFIAVLVRIDVAILVALFTLAIAGRNARMVVSAAAGASAAIALTAVNSWLITGSWISNSMAAKQYWASTTEFLPAIAWARLMAVTGPGFVLTELQSAVSLRSFVVIAAITAGAALLSVREWRKDARRGSLAIASTAAIAAYTFAYAWGVDIIRDNYAGNIFVPMFVLTCATLSAAGKYGSGVAAGIGVTAIALTIASPWRAPYQLHIANSAALLIAGVPATARVAAWNAGLAGWQTGKRVTNLDGLANADVVEPMRTGTLACYLREARITHIMDYGFMFAGQIDTGFSRDEESRRRMLLRRNGYDSAELYRCTSLIKSAPAAELPSEYRLFALDTECLAAVCGALRR
jgi:hypothetical protein